MLGKNLQIAAAGAAGVAEGLDITDAFSTYLYTGNGNGKQIKNGIALGTGVAIDPGTALGGGFFAGFISSTANGVPTHALIVAPRATGESASLQWQTSDSTTGATSPFDGAANTALMTNSPAANFCTSLTIGGYSDWYLPAIYELDIAYFHLKPTTVNNSAGSGINDYSVPKRTANYTAGDPAKTSIAAFQEGGSEAFVADFHWSSTELLSTVARRVLFDTGFQGNDSKTNNLRVRAFRKIAINDPLLDAYRVTGEGGLVWTKARLGDQQTASHQLNDTARGANWVLFIGANAQVDRPDGITSFNSDGYTIGSNAAYNSSLLTNYVSWTFRKAPKFFDIVTYTGNGVAGRTIAHDLGSVPGCIIVKRTDDVTDWAVYHRSLDANNILRLNTTASTEPGANVFGSVSSTEFAVLPDSKVNASGGTYVAYVFAHDAGGFGEDGDQNVISCGSYTTDGSGNATVNLGWEPQWILSKNPNTSSNWEIEDVSRGASVNEFGSFKLLANSSSAESAASRGIRPSATGFNIVGGAGLANSTFIYIAIRRGPLKQPTSGTEVFASKVGRDASSTSVPSYSAPITVDAAFSRFKSSIDDNFLGSRLQGRNRLLTNTSAFEVATTDFSFDYQTGWGNIGGANVNFISWMFRRAPGFFDVVAYTGTGSARTVAHSLGAVPELIIIKQRDGSARWAVYTAPTGNGNQLLLDSASATTVSAYWNSTSPTSSVFTVGTANAVNQNTIFYIAYLFASCPGVSKVGSYTGTGSTLNIDCGFTNGARFVLIKRTNISGDWFVWDTARGIVSDIDPFLRLNTSEIENTSTDYIDPLASGFQISSSAPDAINANGSSFIFLAIA